MSHSYSQKELTQSVNVFKDTVPLMRANEIPLTPENYSLWYSYSNGNNSGLRSAIDDNLKKGIIFSKQINDALHRQFIDQQESSSLDGYHTATKELIDKLLQELKDVSGGSSEFVASMEDCEKQLEGSPNVTQLTQIVGEVIEKTRNINEKNRGLVQNLKSMEDEVNSLKSGVASLTEQANTDQLTKLNNRRGFEIEYDLIERDFKENNAQFSLLLIDIDHFKQFNDTHGHTIGDKVLGYVAKTLSTGISSNDVAARFGGEEFLIILRGLDNVKAKNIANELRETVSKKNLRSNQAKESLGNVTVSIGVATMSKDDDMDSLIERADKAMYKAKANGRNQVC